MTIAYPATLPFRLRVLHALTDTLKSISVADGYNFNMADDPTGVGERVFRGRAWYGDSDPIPMLSVLEGTGPADDAVEPHWKAPTASYDWPIYIQGFVNDDPTHPTDPAYVLAADVIKRLTVEKIRKRPNSNAEPDPFGLGAGKNSVNGLIIGSPNVRPADDVSAKAWFWLTVTIKTTEDQRDPYA